MAITRYCTSTILTIFIGQLPEQPDAPGSDYETWIPRSGDESGSECLLGHKVRYVRRKRLADCYNTVDGSLPTFIANCECTDTDWEWYVGLIN